MKRPSSSKVRINYLESKQMKILRFLNEGIFVHWKTEGVQILTIEYAPEIPVDEKSPAPREQPSLSGSSGSGVVTIETA
jgi:hypothetical protein